MATWEGIIRRNNFHRESAVIRKSVATRTQMRRERTPCDCCGKQATCEVSFAFAHVVFCDSRIRFYWACTACAAFAYRYTREWTAHKAARGVQA